MIRFGVRYDEIITELKYVCKSKTAVPVDQVYVSVKSTFTIIRFIVAPFYIFSNSMDLSFRLAISFILSKRYHGHSRQISAHYYHSFF
jgi:hypothetical protein